MNFDQNSYYFNNPANNPAFVRQPDIAAQCRFEQESYLNLPEQFLEQLRMATHGFLSQYPPGFLRHLLAYFADGDLIEDEEGHCLLDKLTLTADEIERRRQRDSFANDSSAIISAIA